jgi:hypothetical protein
MSRAHNQIPANRTQPRQRKREHLWTEHEVAPFIMVSKQTLRRWRKCGKGPPFLKLGSEPGAPVRYVADDVRTWLTALRHPGQQAA